MKYKLQAADILDVQQHLHEIESRQVTVPDEVWKLFWRIYENRGDGEAYQRVLGFIGAC